MHGYAYASNSPTSYVDTTGLREVCGTGNGDYTCGGTTTEVKGSVPDTVVAPLTPEQISKDIANAKAEKEKAEATKKRSLLDMIKEQGLAFLLDFFGITDIIKCFTKGDIGACVQTLVGMIPWGKVFKAGKLIISGINRAFKTYKAWQKAIRLAEQVIARADEAIAALQRQADEIAEALVGKKAAGAADAAGGSCTDSSLRELGPEYGLTLFVQLNQPAGRSEAEPLWCSVLDGVHTASRLCLLAWSHGLLC
jgi:hypothetical protein